MFLSTTTYKNHIYIYDDDDDDDEDDILFIMH